MSLIEPLGVSARSRCTASLRPGISPRGSVSFSDSPALVAVSIRYASQSFVVSKDTSITTVLAVSTTD